MLDKFKEWLWSHMKMFIGIFISTALLRSGGFVGRMFGTLGLAFVAYRYVMPEVKTFLYRYLSGVPAEALNLIQYVRLDTAMVLICSAGVVRLSSKLFFARAQGQH